MNEHQDPREPHEGAAPVPPAGATPPLPPVPPLPERAPRNPAVTAYLRAIPTPAGLQTLAWIAGAVLAAGLLGAVLLLVLMNSAQSGSAPGLGEMIGNLLVAIGMSLGGGLGVRTSVDTEFFAEVGNASLTVFPLGILALVVTGVTLVSRWRMRVDRAVAPTLGAEAARAGIEAAAIALVCTLLTGFAKLGGAFDGGEVGVRTQAGLVFVAVLVTVAVSLFLARTALRRSVQGAADGTWVTALREAGRYLAVQFTAFGGVLLIALGVVAVQSESAAPLLAGIPLLGNLAAAGAGLGHFGSLSMGAGGMGSMSVSALDIPNGHGAWLFVLALLSTVAAAGLLGIRRQRTASPAWHRVWQMPLVVFGAWCLLALGVAGISVRGELPSLMGISAAGSLGLTWTAPFLVGIGAALASVAAEYLPLLVYRINPALLRAFGGRRAVDTWLAGTAPAAAAAGVAAVGFAAPADPAVPAGPTAPEAPAAAVPGTPIPAAAVAPEAQPPAAESALPAEPEVSGDAAPVAAPSIPAVPLAPEPAADAAPAAPAAPVVQPSDATPTEVLGHDPLLGGLLAPAAVDQATPLAGAAAAPHAGAAAPPAAAPFAGAAPALHERAPMPERTKRTLIITLSAILGVGLLAIAAMITVSVMNQGRDPAGAVRNYLALLEQGKAEQATKLVDPGLQSADRALLTDAVLAAAEHRIEVVDVETLHRSDSGAEVRATLSLDGERFEHSFAVASGPKEFLVLDTWVLDQPLVVEAELTGEGIDALRVGETEIQLESSESTWGDWNSRSVYVYPGVYAVTGPESEFVSVSTAELRAVPAEFLGEVGAEVTVAPSEKFEAAILQQVQTRIAQCVEIPTNMDSVCPYLTQDKDLSEMRVVTQPDGFEEISLGSFVAGEGKIAVRSNPSTFNSAPDLRETTVTVRGEIRFVDGAPTVTDLVIW